MKTFNFKFKKLDFGKKVLSNLQFKQPVLGKVTNTTSNLFNFNKFKQNIVSDGKSKNKWGPDEYSGRGLNFATSNWFGEKENPEYSRRKVLMDPEEFLHRQHAQAKTEASFDVWKASVSKERINSLKEGILSPTNEVPLPIEEYDVFGNRKDLQEGRHRGLAAQQLGIKIPVIQARQTVIPHERPSKDKLFESQYWDDDWKKEKINPNNMWDTETDKFEVVSDDQSKNKIKWIRR